MRACGGVEVQIYIFLTSALVGGEWSASRPCRFTPEERAPGTYWIRGWVGPIGGMDNVGKRKLLALPGSEFRPLGHPARSQLLYRLRYPGSHNSNNNNNNQELVQWATNGGRTTWIQLHPALWVNRLDTTVAGTEGSLRLIPKPNNWPRTIHFPFSRFISLTFILMLYSGLFIPIWNERKFCIHFSFLSILITQSTYTA
jgi:hypothetical protein